MIPVDRFRRQVRNGVVSLILLYLSWPVTIIHRFWNNSSPKKVNWFVVNVYKNDKLFTQDIQWYFYDTGNMLAGIFIILSFILLKTKNRTYTLTLIIILIINIIDLIHYWVCFKQDERVVWLESMLMVVLSLYLIIKRKWNAN